MQDIIELLTLRTSQMEFTTFGVGKSPTGLDKLGILNGLSRIQLHYLFAIFLHERASLITLRAHLSSVPELQLPEGLKHHQLKVINGALRALTDNGYREVMCYKCKGKGCEHCCHTGKNTKKPKEYQLCNFPRGTWYNKNNRPVREMYEQILDYLFKIQSDVSRQINKNKQLTQ